MHDRVHYSTFRRKEQPSVKRALPPVGWHSTVEQAAQNTTVEAWLNMVVLHERATTTSSAAGRRGCSPIKQQPAAGSTSGCATIRCAHLEAARALDVHEEAVRLLHQALQLVELGLVRSGRGEQVVIDLHEGAPSSTKSLHWEQVDISSQTSMCQQHECHGSISVHQHAAGRKSSAAPLPLVPELRLERIRDEAAAVVLRAWLKSGGTGGNPFFQKTHCVRSSLEILRSFRARFKRSRELVLFFTPFKIASASSAPCLRKLALVTARF
jgi:hypothetical protein